jgi:hypothetical protein
MELDKSRIVKELGLRDEIVRGASRHPEVTYKVDTPWFIFASTWFHQWTQFIASFANTVPVPVPHPGRIQLLSLLDTSPEEVGLTSPDNPFNLTLKSKLVIQRDYMILTQTQWEYLSQTYGSEGDLTIKRFGPSARAVRLYAKKVKVVMTAIDAENVMVLGPVLYKCHPELTPRQLLDLLVVCPGVPDFITNAVHIGVSIIPLPVYQNMAKVSLYDQELLLRNNDLDLSIEKPVEKILRPNSGFVVKGQVNITQISEQVQNRKSLVGRISESPKKLQVITESPSKPFEIEAE